LARLLRAKYLITRLIYIKRSFLLLRLSSARLASPAGPTSTAAKPGFKEEDECIFYHPFYTSKLSNFATANLILYQSQLSIAAFIFTRLASHKLCVAGDLDLAEEGEMLCLCILHLLSFPNLLPQKVLIFGTLN